MNPVLTASRPRSSRLTSAATVLMVIAIASALILAFSRLGIGDAVTYRTLTVENPTPYIINVEVTSDERDGWFDVGTVRRESHQTFEGLADPGDEWLFRFSYGGVVGGELTVRRNDLSMNGWKLTVPAAVADRLREARLAQSSA